MTEVVLITGASAGIGKATAFAFAEQGSQLVLAARSAEPLKQVALELEQTLDAEVLAVPTDVTDPEQVSALISQALERFEQIDIVVNNAGICMSGPTVDSTLEQWQQVMAVNFWGYVHVIRAVLPHLIERRKGQIVNVGSLGGKLPIPQMTAYCASKYAVAGLTEALRMELAGHSIEVIGIHPGIVQSEFLQRAIFTDPVAGKAQMESALTGPFVNSSEEVAEALIQACRQHKTDVTVGLSQLAVGAYRLFPELVTAALSTVKS
ncbi:MAG: SDR family oxidoreductase [Synechococcaceae cyanobacterium SM2_3_2]|nr:SDR family oxidoreductase [Synechococcaceae cyanobacterium SM2_3_2]